MLGIKVLLLLSAFSFLLSIKEKKFLFISFWTNIILFIFTYTFVNDVFADDRAQYYNWFLNIDAFLLSHPDKSFSYLLAFMSNFTSSKIGFFFSLGIVFLFLKFLSVSKYLNWKQLTIFLSLLLLNRLYLDYDLSAIRSTFLCLFLLLIYTRVEISKKNIYLILLPVAIFLHYSSFVLIAFFYVLSSIRFINIKVAFCVFFLGASVFLFDISFLSILLNELNVVSYLKYINNNADEFIILSNCSTSLSLKIQILIYVIVPAYLVYKARFTKEFDYHIKFSLLSVGIILLSYNSFPILSRSLAFFMPLVYFLFVQLFQGKSKVLYYYTSLVVFVNSIIFYKNIDLLNI